MPAPSPYSHAVLVLGANLAFASITKALATFIGEAADKVLLLKRTDVAQIASLRADLPLTLIALRIASASAKDAAKWPNPIHSMVAGIVKAILKTRPELNHVRVDTSPLPDFEILFFQFFLKTNEI